MAVKAFPRGLEDFAIFVCVTTGEGEVTLKAAQAKLEHNALAGIHLGHIGNLFPFDFKVLVEDAARQSVGDVVFIID
jgi:NAD kinase